METLESLGLAGHKTFNYADYLTEKALVCCGWMDIHEDSDNLGDSRNPVFSVDPLYWDSEAVFIIRPAKKWHKLSLADFNSRKRVPGIKYTEEGFSFDATKYHGLVTSCVAKKLTDDLSYEFSSEYKNFANSCSQITAPKLVWKWHDPS